LSIFHSQIYSIIFEKIFFHIQQILELYAITTIQFIVCKGRKERKETKERGRVERTGRTSTGKNNEEEK
jgi:hypothetical protein